MEKEKNNKLAKIISLCKRRGFVYPGSEIYGGLANTFDYGPLGVEILRNIKNHWWKTFVQQKDNIYGIDGGIILSKKVWEASGHIQGFIDTLVECKNCHQRFRTDQLPSREKNCPNCQGELTLPKKFNPMFKTFIGAVENEASITYLRPETAQVIFINFLNIIDSFHPTLPFGIAQIGKAFRNEITLGKFIFRTLEFEQMEIEYFIKEEQWEKTFAEWKRLMGNWIVKLGVKKENLRWRIHSKEELSHYSKRTEDLEFNFDGEYRELYGVAYRTNFDLRKHSEFSGRDLRYQNPESGEKFYPHVVEPTFGVNRTMLALLLDAYEEDKDRVVLKLNPLIAPFKLAVFPLLANKKDLIQKAKEIYDSLKSEFMSAWDDRGNIGKRYFSQDEIGTPWCITIDFQTLKNNTITIRDRDTTNQIRIKTSEVKEWLKDQLIKNER